MCHHNIILSIRETHSCLRIRAQVQTETQKDSKLRSAIKYRDKSVAFPLSFLLKFQALHRNRESIRAADALRRARYVAGVIVREFKQLIK